MNLQTNQMSLIHDTDEIIKFLELASRNAILSEAGVQCRITACNHLFSVLGEEEKNADYILAHLDVLMNRIRNKNASVKPATLKVYKSRIKSSLEDYLAWSRDPIEWERSFLEKSKLETAKKILPKVKTAREAKNKENFSETDSESETGNDSKRSLRRLHFPIRSDFEIEITLPVGGLTTKELIRLGLFLYPYCKDLDAKESILEWSTPGGVN